MNNKKVPLEETGKKQAPGKLALLQAFVNSKDIEDNIEKFQTPDHLQEWFHHYEFLDEDERINEEEWQEALHFREAIRNVLLANNGQELDKGSVEIINSIIQKSVFHLQLQSNTEMLVKPLSAGAYKALGKMMEIIYQAMENGTWKRLKTCPYHTCFWVFYDHSKNLSGTWCSMEICGSRVKSKAYRQRKTSTSND